MSERPLLLVDIDGVLNPFAAATCPEGLEERSTPLSVWSEQMSTGSLHGAPR